MSISLRRVSVFLAGLCLFLGGLVSGAIAHPHVFVEAQSHLVFDDKGMAVAIDHVFRFDDAYSAFAIQGFDTNGDGKYSREELQDLAKVNIDSMADYGFFTFGDNTKVELDFTKPTKYWLDMVTVPIDDYWALTPEDVRQMREDAKRFHQEPLTKVDLLELHFRLPLKTPTDATHPITLDVYDPTYFVDFRFAKAPSATSVTNAPGTCEVVRHAPPPLDAATAAALAAVGADQRELPPELQAIGASLVNQMVITCKGAKVVAAGNTAEPLGKPSVPGEAARIASGQSKSKTQQDSALLDAAAKKALTLALNQDYMASQKANSGSITLQAEIAEEQAHASGVGVGNSTDAVRADTPSVAAGTDVQGSAVPADGVVRSVPKIGLGTLIFGTIARFQNEFYRELVNAMRSFRTNPNAAWWLVLLSFAYGVFHAVGPGHGKAIISSYVIASGDTLKKGIILSFISAFAQALTAIVLVGGLAVVLGLTSIAIQDTARWFEVGSYVLIILLGAWLFWVKALAPLFGLGHSHHAHAHGPSHTHSHAHTYETFAAHDHRPHDHLDYGDSDNAGYAVEHDAVALGSQEICPTCGHAHAPTLEMLTGKITLARAASIVMAVGLRPCSGALIVLVFALSQGMILAGIGATLAMSVGTGITVATLAGLAVGAKGVAVRLFGGNSGAAIVLHRTVEIGGALLVLLLGLSMFIAAVFFGTYAPS